MVTAKKRKVSKRKAAAKVEGVNYRVYRKKVPGSKHEFVTARKSDTGRIKDSFVHRYMRTVGFKLSSNDEEDISTNKLMLETHSKSSAVVDATYNAINSQSMFECFVLQHMKETAYGCWLLSIVEQFDSDGQPKKQSRKDAIAFQVPSVLAVTTWMEHLFAPSSNAKALLDSSSSSSGLEGRGNRSKTIETRIGGLSTTTKQGGQHTPFVGILIDKLKFYRGEEEDIDINDAPAFDVGHDLPAMHKAVFDPNCKIGWTFIRRLEVWCAALAQANICGRASCVSQYSPKWEHVQYPDCFDSDGLPPWVILRLTNWKQKKSVREGGHELEFMIFRNHLDQRFCFVTHFILMKHMLSNVHKYDITKGPIFGHAFGTEGTEKQSINYRNALKHMFVVASKIDPKFEHLAECSSHSIRRTFAQWADTCGLDIGKIMSIGRWRDILTLKKYVDDNQNNHILYISIDGTYQPKGFDFFVFTTKCFPARKLN
jgi:hypothetical protein